MGKKAEKEAAEKIAAADTADANASSKDLLMNNPIDNAECDDNATQFTADEWKSFNAKSQAEVLLQYRLTFLSEAMVNWCPALGTVLANDEVKDGVSERGGHPVERKKMKKPNADASSKIKSILASLQFERNQTKKFFDVSVSEKLL